MPGHDQSSRALSQSGLSVIGVNSAGHWIVRGPHDAHGEVFVSRSQALKFALFKNGNQPHAVIMVPGTLD
jgi:hypothetical protein